MRGFTGEQRAGGTGGAGKPRRSAHSEQTLGGFQALLGEAIEGALCRSLPIELADRMFFPGLGPSSAADDLARGLCGVCPGRAQCEAAGAGEAYGTWGGITALERHGRRVF